LLPGNVEVIALELDFFQFALKFMLVDAQVEKGRDEHVSRNAAKDVEI
jgi:hypothetical protein